MNFFSHLFPVPPNFLPDVIDVASDRKKVSTLLEYVALASTTAEQLKNNRFILLVPLVFWKTKEYSRLKVIWR